MSLASLPSLLLQQLGNGAVIHSGGKLEETTFVRLFMSSTDPTRACARMCMWGDPRGSLDKSIPGLSAGQALLSQLEGLCWDNSGAQSWSDSQHIKQQHPWAKQSSKDFNTMDLGTDVLQR